ncbi:MAG: asparagine synthase (glutamine-hydrolyzing) [Xanthobacteraceae bacterium]
MCGIVGFFDAKGRYDAVNLQRIAQAMADQVVFRGPDDSGTYVNETIGLALGFRRLAIVDLTLAGHQPMRSSSKRSAIVFNGEIYNAAVLRAELFGRGLAFRGHCDTEVLLEACEAWGVERALDRVVGMFAFAFFDNRSHVLTLVRDRLGKKPLYYGSYKGCFIFGSQPRTFFPHPLFEPEIDGPALSGFIRFGYVPNPRTIYSSMHQVPPGGLLRVSKGGRVAVERYWHAEKLAAAAKEEPVNDETQAVKELDQLLRAAVAQRMIADVPLGALLSGGIDSSLVVALMQSQSKDPVKTFSIGFKEEQYNEAPHAKAVARHLRTEHHELYVMPADALALVNELPDHFDEPFADSSQIPTLLVSRMARRQVTVALSGDGGDELFAGYARYAELADVERNRTGASRRGASELARLTALLAGSSRAFLPARLQELALRWSTRWTHMRIEHVYRDMVAQGWDPELAMLQNSEAPAASWNAALADAFPGAVERCQMIDTLTYLPDDILVKVDRASMAYALEVRSPLLDHRVLAYAWRLPLALKIREGQQKWVLRKVLEAYVPNELIDRPKMGFGVPIDAWLRGPLRPWAEDLLEPVRLREDGFFNVPLIQSRWRRHLAGESHQYGLWCVLMFQAWKRRWMEQPRRIAAA